MRALQLIICSILAACGGAHADAPASFGRIDAQSIQWQELTHAALSGASLTLTRPPAVARSAELPLRPLTLYDVSASMARGPGSGLRFELTWQDAQDKPHTWSPVWQLPGAPHPIDLPLSPRAQHYVQGLVLPPGASRPQLLLRLDASPLPQLVRYSRWELQQLQFVARGAVRCCERQGDDRLARGDLEGPLADALPLGWQQWGAGPDNRLELVDLKDEPARQHVLRLAPGKRALLAASVPVPVERGRAYRVSLLARGSGEVSLHVIAASREPPLAVRVGNAGTQSDFEVHTRGWTELHAPWFAEAVHVASARVVIALLARDTLEIDGIELRPYE